MDSPVGIMVLAGYLGFWLLITILGALFEVKESFRRRKIHPI